MELQGRKILLGVSGGIAAYKVPLIVRELVKRGAEVRLVLTESAHQFVAATTLEVLSHHPVHTDLFERNEEFPVLHVGLAEWAELVLIAPATANIVGKFAGALADDLLSTLMLSVRAPVFIAPAMEENMLLHPLVQGNLQVLSEHGFAQIEPEEGELASGAVGQGRMAEPETIVGHLVRHFVGAGDLEGLRLLVTAGPTVEDLDPVRFITNRSTGKMGFAVAQRALERGARVVLVCGPTTLSPPPGVDLRPVRSTLEMQRVAEEVFDQVDGAILAAAPADYRSRQIADQKIKRTGEALTVELVENPDIAAGLGRRKGERALVCFAMETEKGLERAREKLARKNCDFIVLNNLGEEGAGFAVDTNVVTLIDADGNAEKLPKMSKAEVADRILDRLAVGGAGRT